MGVSTLPRTGLEGRGKGGSFGARLASRSPLLTVPSAGEQRSKAASMTEEEGTFARGIRLLRRSGLTWESCSNTTAVSTGSGLETEAQRSFRESQCNRSTHREFLFSPFCMGRSHRYRVMNSRVCSSPPPPAEFVGTLSWGGGGELELVL